MAGRAMELKAFFSSTCSRSHRVLPCTASTWACTHIAATSQGLPIANVVWSGERAAAAFRPRADARSHFYTSLRRVSPTAIVRTPPSFCVVG